MSKHPCVVAQEAIVVLAFQNGVAIDDIARAIFRTPEGVRRILGRLGIENVDENQLCNNPGADEGVDPDTDEGPANRASKYLLEDLAFQNAMYRAVKRGLEKPPMIGVFKDYTAPDALSQFVPEQSYSGCSSPAQDCAELGSRLG